MRRFKLSVFLGVLLASLAFSQEPDLRWEGWLSYSGLQATGPASWLTGDGGRLYAGDADQSSGWGRAHLALEYEPSPYFRAFVHALGRLERDDVQGKAWGFPEAYLETQVTRGRHGFTAKAGWFFPPTSMENAESLWTSPYTLSLSAINSWLAEELRLTGLDLRYSLDLAETTLYFETTLLAGNDSLGAVIAWRGWTLGQRLTVWGETLPLPPLESLQAGGAFDIQSDSGTQPVTRDLDDHLGFSARFAYEGPRVMLTFHHLDNAGDRGFYRGDYSWETRFSQVGFSWDAYPWLTLLGEYMHGSTGMGLQDRPHVQTDFAAWYLLPSLTWGKTRFSLRYDDFEVVDKDRLKGFDNAEANDEQGDAWTVACFYQLGPAWRLGLEWLTADIARPQPEMTQIPANPAGESWTLEIRFQF